jgi:hypothetical protein
MILRLLLGAGIGGGVSWYLGKRDQQSLMRSAGIGAGAMLLSPLLNGNAGSLAGDKGAWWELPASWTDPAPAKPKAAPAPPGGGGAGGTGFYQDEGGYAWYYDYSAKLVSMLASPKGGARVVYKKAEKPDAYMKVWNAVVKGKTAVGGADPKGTVLAYAAARGGKPTGKSGAAAAAPSGGGRTSAPTTDVAAPPQVVGDFVDKVAAMVGATRQQVYIGAGALVVGVGAAIYLSSRGSGSSRPARAALA